MAKLAFSKLNKIKSKEEVEVSIGEYTALVKQYLPLEEKIDLMVAVLDQAGADEGYFNMVKLKVYYTIEMIKAYTNITFTDKQLAEATKLYDAIILNDIQNKIFDRIPAEESSYVWNAIVGMAKAITDYNRSFAGMLRTISEDYSTLDSEISDIQQKITTPELGALVQRFLPEAGLTN